MVGTIVAAFFLGAFAANSIPHLAKGMTGQANQTPLGSLLFAAGLAYVWSHHPEYNQLQTPERDGSHTL